MLGVRPALAAHMVDSVAACDAALRVDVPGFGPGFYRYVGDRYGFDPRTGERTRGMCVRAAAQGDDEGVTLRGPRRIQPGLRNDTMYVPLSAVPYPK
ncbi:hypothetical protein WME98_49655 [Sorangium sp. So ce296]|uniref:hypothetical protein n=1 Tax=Sorangium sp. So ce296 TaxID=3133296 RepID=UPI003F60E429